MTVIILTEMNYKNDTIEDDQVAKPVYVDMQSELEALYMSSYKSLVAFAVLFILPREVAEEVVQEVFVETLARVQRQKSYRIDNVEAYIKSAIALKARNKHRRNFLRSVKENDLNENYRIQLSHSDSENENLEKISNAIESLPNAQKECIVLKYYEQMKISEIAKFLSVSEGTVKTHLHRATSTLKTNIFGNK
ncbi:MAG: RNA polymerase sigma factor [Acidimicrobiia bacterium]